MRGHIERRGPNTFLVVIEAGRNAADKRVRHYHQVKGSKRAAEKVLTAKLAELDAGTYVAPNSLTVADWLRQWLEGTARMRVTPKTHEAYVGWVNGRIIPLLGHYRLETLTGVAIQAAWAQLLATKRKDGKAGAGISPKSIRNCHGILRAALNTAVKHGILARNPCDLADLPRAEKQEMHALDAAQINRLLDACRGRRIFMPVLLAVTVGMRRGEILALRWSDVDFDAKVLTVARATEQTRAHGVRMKEPKSGRVRKINMPPLLADELRRHREEQGRVQGLVICHEDGAPISPSAITQEFSKFVRTVEGVPNVRLHDLRHACASLLLSLGIPLPVVSEILGHADTAITARVYSHVLNSSRIEAATLMDDVLRKAQGGG
jgi:integrase